MILPPVPVTKFPSKTQARSDTMNIKYLLFSAALLLSVATSPGAEPKRVSISGYDTMKYSVTSIEASPGQQVIVELKNEGSLPKDAMGHNWILLKAGVDPAS